MHLKSLSLKGFKSFPDRTRLDFAPGVSVIVGPNGSGKSNVTDAVLWVMGEQSPLAVRGQTMQDVIFAGGRGVQARTSAEVELVLDNSDGSIDVPSAEISIVRRLERGGEGEYRLNGARCRLVDVLEVLSDTGLGKEMHSVVSQGRVEAIVTSKASDRRLLIEEAAGLGKHRKRRRRAQLKLERTQDNLDRSLDVEREARARLRPLKRQAEAAELHSRLQRQTDEAQWELARDTLRARGAELVAAEAEAAEATALRRHAEEQLGQVAARRELAESAMAARTERRETLARAVEKARGATDRVDLRLERVRETAATVTARSVHREALLARLREQDSSDGGDAAVNARIAELEAEAGRLDSEWTADLELALAALERELDQHREKADDLANWAQERRAALRAADEACELAREARRAAEASAEAARQEAARVGAELARANQFLRVHSGGSARSLADDLEIEPGLELALSAALGGRLAAAVAGSRADAASMLDGLGADGGRVLVSRDGRDDGSSSSPVAGARNLADLVRGEKRTLGLARRLLRDSWVVDSIDDVPADFEGVAVTTAGRAWSGGPAELRQVVHGGSELVLEQRNRRDALIAESERAVTAEHESLGAIDAARSALAAADSSRDEAEGALRLAERAEGDGRESVRRSQALLEQRRQAPAEGATAARRVQVEAELVAQRALADGAATQREARGRRLEALEAAVVLDATIGPVAARLAEALEATVSAMGDHVETLDAALAADRAAGEGEGVELRECASAEAQIQSSLRDRSDAVTRTEVRAQQLRDSRSESVLALRGLAEQLGLSAEPREEALDEDEREALRIRVDRLLKRREQLGPVNPLAKQEYDEALEHVTELETQRADLETALRELQALIRDTDRQIRRSFEETFNAAAANFENLAETLFPGGRGRLRLVREERPPKAVAGDRDRPDDGTSEVTAEAAAEAAAEAEAAERDASASPDDDLGVEIEITPAGKSMKRLSLLSGGEKSMTALAFLFAVFLAKPCPFYILDEVEAALDDLNITRFLDLLRSHADEAQFIVVTHQKRTMEVADTLYGVSMGGDGVSKVVSRKLPRQEPPEIRASRGPAASAEALA